MFNLWVYHAALWTEAWFYPLQVRAIFAFRGFSQINRSVIPMQVVRSCYSSVKLLLLLCLSMLITYSSDPVYNTYFSELAKTNIHIFNFQKRGTRVLEAKGPPLQIYHKNHGPCL